MITDTSRSPYARLSAIPYKDVAWTGGLYKERFDTVAAVTVPHLQRMFEEKDISHVVENLGLRRHRFWRRRFLQVVRGRGLYSRKDRE